MYIAVIYSPVKKTSKAREKDRLADSEVFESVPAVQAALEKFGHRVEPVCLDEGEFHKLCKYDWIFNLAESVNGFPLADHEIAARLEALAIPFTGSGSRTLKISANKSLAKQKIEANGIQTPAFQVFEPGEAIIHRMGYPLFVKPAYEDASIGITERSVVYDLRQLVRQVKQVQRTYRQAALVEEFIDGRDISVGFLGNQAERVILPPSECVFLADFPGPKILTFDSKWKPDSLAFKNAITRCPCELDADLTAAVQSIGAQVFHLLGCRDYARVDFRLKDGALYLLEVNPNPSVVPQDSGFIRAGAAAGLDYDEVIHRILEQSVKEWEWVQGVNHRRHFIEYGRERAYPSRPIFINKDFIQY